MESARRKAGLPVSTVAAEAGIADKTFRRRQKAPGKFLLEEIIATASALNVDVAEFFADEEEKAAVA